MAGDAQHSPEPWSVDEWGNVRCGEGLVFGGSDWEWDKEPRGEVPPDARRIVACVNALAGVPTEALEAGELGRAVDHLARITTGEDLLGEVWRETERVLRALGKLPALGKDAP